MIRCFSHLLKIIQLSGWGYILFPLVIVITLILLVERIYTFRNQTKKLIKALKRNNLDKFSPNHLIQIYNAILSRRIHWFLIFGIISVFHIILYGLYGFLGVIEKMVETGFDFSFYYEPLRTIISEGIVFAIIAFIEFIIYVFLISWKIYLVNSIYLRLEHR